MVEVKKDTVTVTKTVETEEDVFTLTLTTDEAAVLRAVVGAVGGNGDYRNVTSAIYNALDLAGFKNVLVSEKGTLVNLKSDVPYGTKANVIPEWERIRPRGYRTNW